VSYLRSVTQPFATAVPQTEPLANQVANSAGGFSYAVSDWDRLTRFLILGSEGGSYYASEQKLTVENAKCVERCLAVDGVRVVKAVVEVSDSGRAPKNDPAILALALCLKKGDDATRATAVRAVPLVCRTGTHLMHLAAFVNDLGGWGRGTKRAFAQWYQGKSASDLAYQLVKYQARDGWSNRDILRLAHPAAPTVDHATLFAWACGKEVDHSLLPDHVRAFEALKANPTPAQAFDAVTRHNLPREAIPTELLKEPSVWEALLPRMGLTALIRNLATMTRIGLLKSGSEAASLVCSRLSDGEQLRKSRVHPIAVLSALKTYQSGASARGSSTWVPVPKVVDALDAAFYAAFGNVESTGKSIELALDVSGSMHGGSVAGIPGLTPAQASVAMAMVTLAVEPNARTAAFSRRYIRDLDISPRRRLDDNVRAIAGLPFETTDCSLPMLYAMKDNLPTDAFFVYTDSETYAGRLHPSEALREYRRRSGINAKLGVIGMVSNGFTIADPNDPGMLDVVGFDTATPNVLAEFIR
jgi:60 kDa SS-A/Ro ribonucleoprotein